MEIQGEHTHARSLKKEPGVGMIDLDARVYMGVQKTMDRSRTYEEKEME